jgi:hypothetical protein
MFKKLFLVFISYFVLFNVSPIFSQYSKEFKKTVKLNRDGKVMVDTYKGEIIVDVWDQPEVEIYARIEADDNIFSSDDEWNVRNTSIEISESDNLVKIKSDYSKINDHKNRHSFLGIFDWGESTSLPFVKYRIKIPNEAKLGIKDYKSDIRTSNTADIDLDTYKGKVQIYKLNGGIELKTYKGEANVEFHNVKNYCYFDTYKGKIDIKIPSENKFDLKVDLDHKADFYSNFDVENHSYKRHKHNDGYYINTPINGGGPKIEVKSYKGDIQIRKI